MTLRAGLLMLSAITAASAYAQVEPARVAASILPGETFDVEKRVTLPEFPPVLDLVMIVDMSGSYENDLATLKQNGIQIAAEVRRSVPDSRFGLATFVDYPQGVYGPATAWPYELVHPLDVNINAWNAALNGLRVIYGGDGPESQLPAIYGAMGELVGYPGFAWRDDAVKVIVLTTDANMHDGAEPGYPGPTMAQVIAALQRNDVKFIGLSAEGGGRAQLTQLAQANGGAVVNVEDGHADAVEAVLEGLEALRYDVTPVPRACPVLGFVFVPPVVRNVGEGQQAVFDEEIRVVNAGAAPADGRVVCLVDFMTGDAVVGTQEVEVSTCVPNACGVCGDLPADVCNGRDDDCDGRTDEAAVEGRACDSGEPGLCSAGAIACQGGREVCIGQVDPVDETCDGDDEDCDGTVDEDAARVGEACQTGQPGRCAPGALGCVAGALVCGDAPTPIDESCNGIDDDCDGRTDETAPGLGMACDTGEPGLCGPGLVDCVMGVEVCTPEAQPVDEICDGEDQDCDGTIDEELPDEGAACFTELPGRCSQGVLRCNAGQVGCVGTVDPVAEDCNGEDDDCDGMTDEGLLSACGTCGEPPAEVCDGVDQDCDDVTDEDAECPDDEVCSDGACRARCINGECEEGFTCVEELCLALCEVYPERCADAGPQADRGTIILPDAGEPDEGTGATPETVGCACDAADGSSEVWPLLLLGVLGLRRRRR